MKIRSETVGAFRENTYLAIDDATHHAVLIDPGAEPERLIAMVRESGATLDAIWLTHAHIDHIGGIAGVRRAYPVPVYLHREDLPIYELGAEHAAAYGVSFEQPDPPDFELTDGQVLTLGELPFEVIHTPGHAPGHVIFKHGDTIFGGDLLFAGSIGRTDLPLANPAHMQASLARACALGDAAVIHPGHGPRTTIGHERATNGFLTGAARIAKK